MPFGNGGGNGVSGDWVSAIGYRSTATTPDGHSFVFMSRANLTGYDSGGLEEVFAYEAVPNRLTCVSCNPSGEPPVPTELGSYGRGVSSFIPISKFPTYRPRVISADGSRVFFDSDQPLVPQDTNSWLSVYEWSAMVLELVTKAQGVSICFPTGPVTKTLI